MNNELSYKKKCTLPSKTSTKKILDNNKNICNSKTKITHTTVTKSESLSETTNLLNNKILKNPKISNYPPKIDINDPVMYFHNGDNWVIIALRYLTVYNLIYSTLYDLISKQKFDITIAWCPITGAAIIVKDHYTYKNINKRGVIITNGKHTFNIIDVNNVKRWNCYIDTLKNVLIHNLDGIYLISKEYKNIKLDKICYLIEYNNKNTIKKTLLIGKNHKIKYDSKGNGLQKYFEKYNKKLDIKLATVMPLFCSFADKLDDVKVINL